MALTEINIETFGAIRTVNTPVSRLTNRLAIQAAAVMAKNYQAKLIIPQADFYYEGSGSKFNPALVFDSIPIILCDGGRLLGQDNTTTPDVAVRIKGNGTQVFNLVVVAVGTTARDDAYGHELFQVIDASNFLLDGCESHNSVASAFHMSGAVDGEITNCTGKGSFADGFHVTGKSKNIKVRYSYALGNGDDYYAVVSYVSDGGYCEDVDFWHCHGGGQTHGRAATVVGGKRVKYRKMSFADAARFGLYVASEASYNTFGVDDVLFEDCMIGNVTGPAPDYGNGLLVLGRTGVAGGASPFAGDSLNVKNIVFKNVYMQNVARYGGLRYVTGSSNITRINVNVVNKAGGQDWVEV